MEHHKSSESHDEIDLIEIFNFFIQKKRVFLSVFAAVILLGSFFLVNFYITHSGISEKKVYLYQVPGIIEGRPERISYNSADSQEAFRIVFRQNQKADYFDYILRVCSVYTRNLDVRDMVTIDVGLPEENESYALIFHIKTYDEMAVEPVELAVLPAAYYMLLSKYLPSGLLRSEVTRLRRIYNRFDKDFVSIISSKPLRAEEISAENLERKIRNLEENLKISLEIERYFRNASKQFSQANQQNQKHDFKTGFKQFLNDLDHKYGENNRSIYEYLFSKQELIFHTKENFNFVMAFFVRVLMVLVLAFTGGIAALGGYRIRQVYKSKMAAKKQI